MQQLGGNSLTVTDTQNSTWHALTSYSNSACGMSNGNYSEAQIWYANNIAAGSNTVTLTINGASAFLWLVVVEYAGLNAGDPVSSNGVVAPMSTTNMNAGSVMTTAPHGLVIGLFHDAVPSGGMAAGSNFMVIAQNPGFVALLEDQINVGPGSYAPTATLSPPADNCWVATAAAFGGN
jgi:hypothetical protein